MTWLNENTPGNVGNTLKVKTCWYESVVIKGCYETVSKRDMLSTKPSLICWELLEQCHHETMPSFQGKLDPRQTSGGKQTLACCGVAILYIRGDRHNAKLSVTGAWKACWTVKQTTWTMEASDIRPPRLHYLTWNPCRYHQSSPRFTLRFSFRSHVPDMKKVLELFRWRCGFARTWDMIHLWIVYTLSRARLLQLRPQKALMGACPPSLLLISQDGEARLHI